MKLAVIGSRGFCDESLFESVLSEYKDHVSMVISGGARGADTMAEAWAKKNNVPVKVFVPDWGKYGKSAGMIRNKYIIEEADECVAFWDGQSKGTANSIFICDKLNKKVKIVNYVN